LRFSGDFSVLIGPATFSSAVSFAVIVKDNELGVLVGEETGGPPSGFGSAYSFRLTYTGLEGYVSSAYFVRPNGQDDGRGVLPDYDVRPEPSDVAAGRDPVLEFTKALIQQQGAWPQQAPLKR
ncbi:MAG: S41 family peptidase, partial [Chloroflexales bacterium]|nr:S41 family peptidase [Chloroflexales bacterium]